MSFIVATSEYGLIVRKAALLERNLTYSEISLVIADVDIQGENANLISYGPIFGIEAQEKLKAALSRLGLVEIDDFYGTDFFLPEWVRMGVASTL